MLKAQLASEIRELISAIRKFGALAEGLELLASVDAEMEVLIAAIGKGGPELNTYAGNLHGLLAKARSALEKIGPRAFIRSLEEVQAALERYHGAHPTIDSTSPSLSANSAGSVTHTKRT